MNPSKAPLHWVIAPAILTLLITAARLMGELQGCNSEWFGQEPGGTSEPATPDNPTPPPSWFGIFWLMPLLGLYFAARLLRSGAAPASRLKALLFPLAGLAVLMGTFAWLVNSQEHVEQDGVMVPVRSVQFLYGLVGAAVIGWVAALVARPGWPALWRLSLAYGAAARVPIIVLTFILCLLNAGTHYEKLAPYAPAGLGALSRAFWLSLAQACLWIPMTILAGMIFGALLTPVVRPRSS